MKGHKLLEASSIDLTVNDEKMTQGFFQNFPTANALPNTRSVAKLYVPGARHCLVHIRQLHDASGVTIDDLHVIQEVQNDIYAILSAKNNGNSISKSAYVEGQSVEQDILEITSEDSAEEVVMQYALQTECIAQVDRLTLQYLESRFRDEYGARWPSVIEQSINRLRQILFNNEELYYNRWLSIADWRMKIIERCNDVVKRYLGRDTVVPSQHFLGSIRLLIDSLSQENIASPDELTKYSFTLIGQLHDYAFEEKALRIQQVLNSIASKAKRVIYAADRLFVESDQAFKMYGAESPLINALCEDAEVDTDIILDARERVVLELISLRRQANAVVLFGGAHDFVRQIEYWNAQRPNDKFCLIEVTPNTYAKYIDDEDSNATPEDIEIRQPVFLYS